MALARVRRRDQSGAAARTSPQPARNTRSEELPPLLMHHGGGDVLSATDLPVTPASNVRHLVFDTLALLFAHQSATADALPPPARPASTRCKHLVL